MRCRCPPDAPATSGTPAHRPLRRERGRSGARLPRARELPQLPSRTPVRGQDLLERSRPGTRNLGRLPGSPDRRWASRGSPAPRPPPGTRRRWRLSAIRSHPRRRCGRWPPTAKTCRLPPGRVLVVDMGSPGSTHHGVVFRPDGTEHVPIGVDPDAIVRQREGRSELAALDRRVTGTTTHHGVRDPARHATPNLAEPRDRADIAGIRRERRCECARRERRGSNPSRGSPTCSLPDRRRPPDTGTTPRAFPTARRDPPYALRQRP